MTVAYKKKLIEVALPLEAINVASAVFKEEVFEVVYKGIAVGEYVPDLIVRDQIVVDAKVIECITDHELGQVMNYLRITGLKVGVIINFRRSKLEWKRVVL